MIKSNSMNKTIEVNPEKLSGVPVFAGTRVPIQNLFDYLEGGDTLEDFLDGFPPVTREQAIDVLELAKKSLLEDAAKN
ncbi:MAG: DUF433 domain-containing protein [Acidobacteria bacterium]|nr:DUF433 domain-containing protein [Acidobacteriota bacterium]MBP7474943.1 DUF433 domain-containing protein [Pyrinomonadaceae bacterium]